MCHKCVTKSYPCGTEDFKVIFNFSPVLSWLCLFQVRTITALALAALAEAATPYGIESFDSVLKPLWKGIRTHRLVIDVF